jgi:hypothetical protein
MPLHLLFISRSSDVPRCAGRGPAHPACAPIEWVVQDALAAATVRLPIASFEPLEHARLLEAIHRQIDLVPVRFGVTLPDEPAVQDLLHRRKDGLLRELDRLKGTGELGVRIEHSAYAGLLTPPRRNVESAMACSPVEYLAIRRRQYAWKDDLEGWARRVAQDCVQAIEGLYCEWRSLAAARPEMLRLAFLVRRNHWQVCHERLTNWMNTVSQPHGTPLGPWPPFSFVNPESALADGSTW